MNRPNDFVFFFTFYLLCLPFVTSEHIAQSVNVDAKVSRGKMNAGTLDEVGQVSAISQLAGRADVDASLVHKPDTVGNLQR